MARALPRQELEDFNPPSLYPTFKRGKPVKFRRFDTVVDGTLYLLRELSAADRDDWNSFIHARSQVAKSPDNPEGIDERDMEFTPEMVSNLWVSYHLIDENEARIYDGSLDDCKAIMQDLPGHTADELWKITRAFYQGDLDAEKNAPARERNLYRKIAFHFGYIDVDEMLGEVPGRIIAEWTDHYYEEPWDYPVSVWPKYAKANTGAQKPAAAPSALRTTTSRPLTKMGIPKPYTRREAAGALNWLIANANIVDRRKLPTNG